MIVTRIRGGLGNQLFQYAAGRALALRLETELALDLRDWRRPRPFPVGLGHFRIRTVDVPWLDPQRARGPVGMLRGALGTLCFTILRERGPGYDPVLEQAGDGSLLRGYWQSERYFADQAATIRRELQPAHPPGPETARLLERLADEPAVSLHVRRGDYVSNPKANAVHGCLSPGYYARAARLIAEAAGIDPVLYVFSDDPFWVRENLALPFETRFVTHNDSSTAHEDLALMAACRHHVIANSTFSWWGAWLDPAPDKIVVAPRRWFADPGRDNPDILPPHWRRIEG